jgi:hypothetical protein
MARCDNWSLGGFGHQLYLFSNAKYAMMYRFVLREHCEITPDSSIPETLARLHMNPRDSHNFYWLVHNHFYDGTKESILSTKQHISGKTFDHLDQKLRFCPNITTPAIEGSVMFSINRLFHRYKLSKFT